MKHKLFFYGSVLAMAYSFVVSLVVVGDTAQAISTPCMVVNDQTGDAAYYAQGTTCGEGSGVNLKKIEGASTYASGNYDDGTCSGVEVWAHGQSAIVYCIMYNLGDSKAEVRKGTGDGGRDDYSIGVTTTNRIAEEKAVLVSGSVAAGQGLAEVVCTKPKSGNSGDLKQYEECVKGAQAAWKECSVTSTYDNWDTKKEHPYMAAATSDDTAKCLQKKYPDYKSKITKSLVNKLRDKADEAETKTSEALSSDKDGDKDGEEGGSCNVDGIGWLLCPTMNFIAGVNDAAFGVVSSWLDVSPTIMDSSANEGTFKAWSAFKDIANVLFVLVFLVIIFAQVSNIGISNYNIKKMLPRLIIGALLVNISFYICQLAVDLSNILGYTLAQTIAGIGDFKNTGSSSLTWVGVIGGILAGASAIVLAAMAITVPVLLAALLSVIVVVVILIARQAAIILLVALAPLAFVAWLLPNTEQWFKRWWKMFWSLLMVFPVIALLYGGASLASNIVASAAIKDKDVLMQVGALGMLLIPLGLTPMVLKGSLGALGSVGAKLSNWSSKANARLGGKVKESRLGDAQRQWKYKSAERQAHRRAGNGFMARQGARLAEYGDERGGKLGAILGATGKATKFAGGGAGRLVDGSALGKAMGLNKGADAATSIVDEMFEKEVKAAAGGDAISGKTHPQLLEMITSGKDADGRRLSEATLTAARDRVMTSGGFGDRRQVLEHVASDPTMSAAKKQRVVQAAYAKGDQNIYGVGFGDAIVGGTLKSAEALQAAAVENAAKGNLQAEHIVASSGATKWLASAINQSGDAAAESNFVSTAQRVYQGNSTASRLSGELENAFNILGVPQPGVAPPSAVSAVSAGDIAGMTPEQTRDFVEAAMRGGPTSAPTAAPSTPPSTPPATPPPGTLPPTPPPRP